MSKRRAILIDSNAIVRKDWLLASAAWKVVLFNAREGHFQLIIPELVIQEVVGRYQEALTEALEKSHAAERELRRLAVDVSIPALAVDDQVERYEATLRAKVLGADGRVPDLPLVEVSHLVNKAIRRLRPFDAAGNGFRDAILWEHVLSLVEEFDPVILVSNDRVAFHVGKDQLGLASELEAEITAQGHAGQGVVLYPDLVTYLKATGTADPKTFASVAELVAGEEEQIGINLEVALRQADIEFRHGQGRIVIEQAHQPVSISLVDVTAPDDDNLALVTLEGDADLDLYVEWWDGTQPDIGSGTKRMTYTATATFDVQQGLLGDFSVAPLRVDIDRDLFPGLGSLLGSAALWRGDEPQL